MDFHLLLTLVSVLTAIESTCITRLENHTKEVCFHERCVNMTYTRLGTYCSSQSVTCRTRVEYATKRVCFDGNYCVNITYTKLGNVCSSVMWIVPSTFSGNTATDALPNHTVASSNLLRTLAPSFSSSKIVNPYSSTDLLEMFSSINRTSMIPTSAILIFTTANIVSSSEPTANISFLHSSNISGSKPILDSTVSSSVEETYFNFSKTLTTVTNITRSITASYMSTTSYTLTTSNIYTTSNMSTISVIDILSMFLSTSINSNRASITVSSGTSQYSFVSKSANAYVQSSFTDLSNSTTSYSQPTRNLNVSSVSTINTSPTMNTTLANTYSANFISISTIQSYLYFSSQNVTATDLVIMSVTTVLPLLSLSITESAIFKSSTSHSSAVYFSTPSITNKTLISSIAENTYSLVASPLYTVIIISSYTPCWVIVTYSINATTSYSPIPSTTFTPIVTWNFQNQTAIQSLFSPISTSVVNISASELIISSTESLYLATSFFSKSIYQSLVTSYSATVVAASSQIRTMYSKNISVYSNSSDSYSNSTLSVMSFTIQPTMATTNSSLKLSVMKTPSLSVLTTMSVETMRNQSVWNTSPLLPVDISTVQSNFTVPLIKDLTTIYKNNVTPIFSSPSTVVLSVFLNTTNGIKTSSSTVSNSTIYSLLHSSSDIIQIKSTLSFMSATSPITTFNNRLSTNFSSVLQTGTSFYSSIVALNLSSTTIFNFSTTTGSFTSAASVIPNVVAGTSFISSDFPQDASTTFSKLNISLFTVNTLFVNSISTKSLLFENSNLSQFNTVLSTPSFKTSSSIQRDLVNSTLTANHFSEFAITPTKAIIGTINISMTETTSINSLNLLSSNNTSLASKTSFKNSSIETVNLRTTPLLYSPSFTTFLSNVRNNSIVLDNNTSAVSQTKELILTESQSYNATTTFLSLKSASSSFSVSGNKILVRKRKDVGELNLNPTSTQPTLGFLTQLYTNVVPQSLSNFSAFNESTLSDSTLLGTELIGSSSTFVSFPFNRSSTITTSVTAIEIGSPVLPITQHLVSSTLSQCLVLYSTIVMVQSSISGMSSLSLYSIRYTQSTQLLTELSMFQSDTLITNDSLVPSTVTIPITSLSTQNNTDILHTRSSLFYTTMFQRNRTFLTPRNTPPCNTGISSSMYSTNARTQNSSIFVSDLSIISHTFISSNFPAISSTFNNVSTIQSPLTAIIGSESLQVKSPTTESTSSRKTSTLQKSSIQSNLLLQSSMKTTWSNTESLHHPTAVTINSTTTIASRIDSTSIASSASLPISSTSFLTHTRTITTQTSLSFVSRLTITTLFSVSSSAVVSTTPIPQDFNVKVTLIISTVVDVNSIQFKSQLEKDLVDTYVSMSAVALRRRRRAAVNGNVTAEVTSIRRRSQYVDIKFFVKENDVKIRPVQVASVYNYLSETGLQQRLGFQVSGPVMIAVASAPYLDSDILGMVLTDISSYNLSSLTNQEDFESKMAQSYKSRRNLSSDLQVAVKVIFVKHERGNQVYIEFYFSVNDVVQNATFVASIYQDIGAPYTELTREFGVEGFKVLSVPYTANSYLFVDTRVNIIRIVLRPSVSSIDVTSAAYKANMALKLSAVYEAGKGVTIRQRRALGSVVTQIEKLQIVNNDQVEVWFIVRDAQIIQNGQNGADVMNKIDTNQMGAILNAVIITKPEPLESLPTALNTNVDYWIIAAVTAPVILLVLIMVLCCWRFKRGGPQRKTAPAPSVEQIEMVDGYKSSKLIPMDEKQVFETQLISESKKPVSSIQLASNNNIPEDEMRTSQRRKVRSVRKPHHYRRQNPQYEDDYGEDEEDEDEFKENEEEEESDEETEEEIVIVRRPVPSPKPRKEVETRRKLEYDATEDRPKKPVRLQPLEKLPVPPPLQGRSPTQLHDPSPIPLISDRRPLELTGSLMVDEELKPIPTPTLNHIAGEMPIFGRMQETRGMTTNPPLRFRTNIENNMAAYLKPTGALPILDLQQTSLVAAPAARQSTQIDPDFQHKSEVERLRNKQRQREAMFGAVPTSNDRTPPQFDKRQQDEINAVLDPDHSSINLSQRKGRLRRRLRRKNKIYMHSEPPSSKKDDILLKSYQNISTPRKQKHFDVSDSQTDETASQSASDISMREANRRIKTLIDDTFATLKKYKNNLPTDSNTGRFSSMKRGENMNSSIHRKYAGMPPSLPEPSPSHGRATTMPTGPDRHREVPPLPYMNPYQQYGPIFSEPMVTWDPLERQRYIQQRLGYPVYGPVASSLTMPYGQAPEHAVYMTPVQQRPDGIGGMVWSPYGTASDAFIGSHLKPPVPGARGDDTAPGLPVATSHSRTLDMSDIGDLKKSSSQPLIRAIKEELLKLSQSANGKTKITELQTEGAAETVTR